MTSYLMQLKNNKVAIGFFLFFLVSISLFSCKVMSKKSYRQMLDEKDSLGYALDEQKVLNYSLSQKNKHLAEDTVKLNNAILTEQQRKAALKQDLNSVSQRLNNLDTTYTLVKGRLSSEKRKLSEEKTKLDRDKKDLIRLRDSLYQDIEKKQKQIKAYEAMVKKRAEIQEGVKKQFDALTKTFSKVNGLKVNIKDFQVYVSISNKLLFRKGSFQIEKQGKSILKKLAGLLNEHPGVMLAVEGHTDADKVLNIKCIQDNWDLSVLRATSVVRFLVNKGDVYPARLIATGKAEFDPLQKGKTEAIKAKNRRIEIVLIPSVQGLYELLD